MGERLANAVNDFRKDPCEEGHKLGETAHTLVDTYCPSHTSRDEHGNIKGYNNYSKQNTRRHSQAHKTLE